MVSFSLRKTGLGWYHCLERSDTVVPSIRRSNAEGVETLGTTIVSTKSQPRHVFAMRHSSASRSIAEISGELSSRLRPMDEIAHERPYDFRAIALVVQCASPDCLRYSQAGSRYTSASGSDTLDSALVTIDLHAGVPEGRVVLEAV